MARRFISRPESFPVAASGNLEGVEVADSQLMIFIVCTIEPDASQFVGASLLHRSLVRSCARPFDFRLTIIRRGSHETFLADIASSLGITVRLAGSEHHNRFLNKWPGLDAHKDLRGAKHVVCLDWDMVLVHRDSFPGPFSNAIGARPNPTDLYAHRLASLKERVAAPPLIQPDFHVPSSINGGLLIATDQRLRQCGEATVRYENLLHASTRGWEYWEREQLALSLAVGETGLRPLDPRWNATWRTSVRPEKVSLWHYSDGCELTMALKRCLHRPEFALALLREIQSTWPHPVAVFLRLYAQILDEPWFRQLTNLGKLRNAA